MLELARTGLRREPVLIQCLVMVAFALAAHFGLHLSDTDQTAAIVVALGVAGFITRRFTTPAPKPTPPAAGSPADPMEHYLMTILDQLASGQLPAPALIKTIAADLKAAEPFLGPAEAWGIDAAERWLATKIPATVAAMLANEIKVELDLVAAPAPEPAQ